MEFDDTQTQPFDRFAGSVGRHCDPTVGIRLWNVTHEELIDLAWNSSIRTLLLEHYPGTSERGL